MSGLAWLGRRSLRTRLVLGSVAPLAVALVVGTMALTGIFASGRLHELDGLTGREASTLAALARSGQLPRPLPLPAGSPLLAQVLSGSGDVLAASSSASEILPLTDDLATTARSTTDGARWTTDEEPTFGSTPLRLRTLPTLLGGRPVLVVVAAPLGDVRRATDALRLVLLLVAPALVLAAVLLVHRLVTAALRPVEQLRDAAERLAAGSGHRARSSPAELLPVPGRDDELARLAGTLNGVLQRLHESAERERTFVADAAHELRSPVASMRLQLDVARAHPGTTSTAELAADLQAEVDRLSRTTEDLLALARLDERQPLRRELLDLTEVADAQGPPAPVLGDRQALERLVRNLQDNATRHTSTVRLTTASEDGAVVLLVDDDGPGIPPGDRDRVFDRWVRLDGARSRSQGGSGLGLALVREIARAHGGDVRATDSPLGGARLVVRLPGAAQQAGPEPEDAPR